MISAARIAKLNRSYRLRAQMIDFYCDAAQGSGVYRILNVKTGEYYIGAAKNLRARMSGHPRPDGRCPACGEQVTTGVANQGQLVDLSNYGVCSEMSPLERLEIDLEHAQDRVVAIERQISRLKRG